jgi:tryptophan synthase alpha chain
LKARRQKAFMPFVTAGDPDLAFTVALLNELAARGCHLCEVGFPYSDPIADGPVIQASYTRALAKRIKVAQIFDALATVPATVTMPRVAMTSYAIIYRHGRERFVEEARTAGVSGLIVPDLPVDESRGMAEICQPLDFSLIQLITPTTPRERALRIAEATSGFIYYVSVAGITGERKELPAQLRDELGWLRGQTALPICVGFGISRPDHVRMLAEVADGFIVGSAIVRRVAEADQQPREQVLAGIGEYVSELLAAVNS